MPIELDQENLDGIRDACVILTRQDSSTEDLSHVTSMLMDFQASQPDQYALAMIHLAEHDESMAIRALAAVSLRRLLTQADLDTYVVEEEVQNHVQTCLMNALRKEELPYVSRNLVDAIASIGEISLGREQWPELIPQALEMATSTLERHRYAALDLFGRLYASCGHLLKSFDSQIYETIARSIAEESPALGAVAVIATCRAVCTIEDPALRLHYQTLVPSILELLIRTLESGEEQEAKVILSALVDLVSFHEDAHFFKKHPKTIANVMSQIALNGDVPLVIRQFALELMTCLIVYLKEVFAKHKFFVETTMNIILEFLCIVPMETVFFEDVEATFEEENALALHLMACSSFGRVTENLGKRTVRNVVIPLLNQMITKYASAYKAWAAKHPHEANDRTGRVIPDVDCTHAIAAYAALTQIVEDKHQLQVFKFPVVAQLLVNPCHPRLRALAVVVLEQIFKHYPVRVRTETHAKFVPALLDLVATPTEYLRIRLLAIECISEFIDDLPENLCSHYAQRIIETSIPYLQEEGMPQMVILSVFELLGRLSGSCPSVFHKYESAVLPILLRYIYEPATEADIELRPSALATLTMIGSHLGESFIPVARGLLEYFVSNNTTFLQGFTVGDEEKDKQRTELQLIQSLARLWNLVPDDFVQCLSIVFPILLNNLIKWPTSSDVTPIRIESGFTIETLREAIQMSLSAMNKVRHELTYENAIEEENPFEALRRSTDAVYDLLDDKAIAIQLFTDLPLTIGRHFAPYAEAAAVVLGYIIATVNHEEIVANALFGYSRLVKCVVDELQHEAVTGQDTTESAILLERVASECITNLINALHLQETHLTRSHALLVIHTVLQHLGEVAFGISLEDGDTLNVGTGFEANGEPIAVGFNPRYPQFQQLFIPEALMKRLVDELRTATATHLKTVKQFQETLRKIADREKDLNQIAASAGVNLQELGLEEEEDPEDGEVGNDDDVDEDDVRGVVDASYRKEFRSAADLAKERQKLARAATSAAEIERNEQESITAIGEALNAFCVAGRGQAFELIKGWIPELLSWMSKDVMMEQRYFPLQILRALIPHAPAECLAAGIIPDVLERCLDLVGDLHDPNVADTAAYVIGLIAEYCTSFFEANPDFIPQILESLVAHLNNTKHVIEEKRAVYESKESDVEVARAQAAHLARRGKKQEEDDEEKDDDDDDDEEDEESNELNSLHYVVDNIVCTIGRFVFYCQATSAFDIWLAHLPVKADAKEGEKTYRLLYAFTQHHLDFVSGPNYSNLPALLMLWSNVYNNIDNSRSLRLLAANLLIYYQTHAGEAAQAAIETLPEEVGGLVVSALEAAPHGVPEPEEEEAGEEGTDG